MKCIYDFEFNDENGEVCSLDQYRGKVLLIVNTASKCGFTPQYSELTELQQRFDQQGFMVLAFPCNQFGRQEQGSAAEIRQFCDSRFKINFPLAAKCDVNGDSALPLFQFLKSSAPGVFATQAIKWNFTKFLIDRNGDVVRRFAPMVKPSAIAPHIETALKADQK